MAQLQVSAHILLRATAQLLMQEQNRDTDIPCRLENSSEMCENLAGTNQTPAVKACPTKNPFFQILFSKYLSFFSKET